jgi:hypothetical protein
VIERQQAEQLAAVWAQRDSERLGFPCTPMVEEFDLGYLIASTAPRDARALPGHLPTTVVDKATGEVSTWPSLPFPAVAQLFRQRRSPEPRAPQTVDAASQLLREITRLPTPAAAAHLTLDGRMHVAHGAKGDVELRHHPLVQSYLDGLRPGRLVRGGERHAEMIVVSDLLHERDHQRAGEGLPPLTLPEAQAALGRSRIDFFRIREAGDGFGGPARTPCDSCVTFLIRFNVLPDGYRAHAEEWQSPRQIDPDPGRFPAEVTNALVEAGWRPHFGDEVLAEAAIRDVLEVNGRRHDHAVFPAAREALIRFPGFETRRQGPGEQVWISRVGIRPWDMAHTADTLADFGALLGVRLFPLGTELGDSIIAVDEQGRIFALDQAGEWFLGPDIDAALTTLLLGRAPARVRDDGTW